MNTHHLITEILIWLSSICTELFEIWYNNVVGVADLSVIQDNQMSASTQYSYITQAAYGRLVENRGNGWCTREATRTDDWLQVDFNRTVQVCGVVTQGDNGGAVFAWVESFELSYISDKNVWTTYEDACGHLKWLVVIRLDLVIHHRFRRETLGYLTPWFNQND